MQPSPVTAKLFEPSVTLRQGESWEHLYVSKAVGSPANEFKVGETGQSPEQRRKPMGGQTDVVFHMLAVFLTLDSKLAERIAFAEFDRLGLRKYPGTRKELFLGTFQQFVDICRSAAAEANRQVRADSFRNSLPTQAVETAVAALLHSAAFWKEALLAPVPFGKNCATLGEMLARAVSDPRIAAKMERIGFVCTARLRSKVDYRVDWQKALPVLKWLQARGYSSPTDYAPRVQFKCP